jgi:hypothetical protein
MSSNSSHSATIAPSQKSISSSKVLWENPRGISVYSFNEAWGKKENETLTHNDIIIHLRKAFDNWIDYTSRPMPKKSCRAIPQFENV